ncbi:MAG: thioredoxin-dependent thiol peroxidase [Candidatus Levybacteria bacterium CG10_big_fil_rev_8_21_14_0_10_35_13]|nr:MAG: thioredoxin-dependent thiol peroxidase [Candidatus Levybacteria bacterium CG10_big_fil_rev_8_21_14_0_10_35_13]
MLKEGDKAPAFRLKDFEGKIHSLSEFLGKKVVLYFYPKDDTPGCTKEACEFRDNYKEFENKNTKIIGISKDDEMSHSRFIKKHSLPFLVLSDPSHETIEKYGAWGERSFMGRKYMGTARMTLLIDEKGKIIKVFVNVKPDIHAQELLRSL